VASGVVTRQVKNPITVEKSDKITQVLNSFLLGERSFSASSLSTYITCPLKFYFTQIEEVREEDELSESVEAKTFGTILHSTMAALYKDFEGRDVTPDDIKSMLASSALISALIQSEFMKEKRIEEVKGYNYVVCNLIERYIRKILLYDLSLAPFRYIESEKRFYTTLKLNDGREIKLKAFVDRLDRLNGELRIVDYKTGGNPDKMISISSLFEPNSAKKTAVFFQLYLYALIVSPHNNSLLSPYFLRELGTRFDNSAGPDELAEFKEGLESIISEILNPQIPFVQTENLKSCDYCPFKQICR